jgi:protein-disulfide isomerase
MSRLFPRLIPILLLATFASAQQPPVSAAPKSPSKSTAPAATAPTRAANAPAPTTKLPSEETVNAFLRQMFGYDSSVTWKIAEIKPSVVEGLAEVTVTVSGPQGQGSNKFYVASDGQHAVTGEIIPFGARPFAADREKLQKGINGPARGPADSPVTIVEFSDLQCPHCKDAQPIIEKLLTDEPNAHFVFQSFPLPSHNWAAKAAAYADCVGRASNDAFWKFVQKTYAAQAEITETNADEKLTAIANDSGVKGADIAACAAKPETAARVEHSVALGKSVDVTGTPSLFINGRKIGLGIPPDILKSMVDFEAKQGK